MSGSPWHHQVASSSADVKDEQDQHGGLGERVKDTLHPKSWRGRADWPDSRKALAREFRGEHNAPLDEPPFLISPLDIYLHGAWHACPSAHPERPDHIALLHLYETLEPQSGAASVVLMVVLMGTTFLVMELENTLVVAVLRGFLAFEV